MSQITVLPPESAVTADGVKAAGWWHAADDGAKVLCDLCPRGCSLAEGKRGFCFVRQNLQGRMVTTTYGRSTGFCIDPIEKKPLNHFYPGSSVLSFGTAGCNLGCKFCQNWEISKSREVDALGEWADPETVARAAQQLGCRSVAFTYNDPVIWAEYAMDCAKACRAVGVKTVAVTAGYISPLARQPFYELMDAANVDLKGFTEDFYRELTNSHLAPVQDTLQWLARESDVWLEVTNLLIPGKNDSEESLKRMSAWLIEALGPDVPLHFTAFHPDFRMKDVPPTPPATLLKAHEIAVRAGLKYVYTGNVHDRARQSTYCPGCSQVLVARDGYHLSDYGLQQDRCGKCGMTIAGRFGDAPGDWGPRREPVRIAAYAQGRGHPGRVDASRAESPHPAASENSTWTPDQDRQIFQAAGRRVISAVLGQVPEPLEKSLADLAPMAVAGAFVTLKRAGMLRGCCGSLGEAMPLCKAIENAAVAVAKDDRRFPPISPVELPYLDMDVWLLSQMEPVLAKGPQRRGAVIIGKHGLRIAKGNHHGLLLPGVAVEHHLDAEGFLEQVCRKAGLPTDAWQDEDATLMTFQGHAIEGAVKTLLPAVRPHGGDASCDASCPRVAESESTAPHPEPLQVLGHPVLRVAGCDRVEGDGHHVPMVVADTVMLRPSPCPADVAKLAGISRQNLQALMLGATPAYYVPDAFDGGVQGVVLSLQLPGRADRIDCSQMNIMGEIPLQSTLFELTKAAAGRLQQNGVRPTAISAASIGVAVLWDAAMHGSCEAPQLQDVDPRHRALFVAQQGRWALAWNPKAGPEDLFREATALLRAPATARGAVFSLAVLSTSDRIAVTNTPEPRAGTDTRLPAAAGTFYPRDADEIRHTLDDWFAHKPAAEPWAAAMVPHAGWIYSGRLAADVFSRVKFPRQIIILAPRHRPDGAEWAVAPHRTWQLPGGCLDSDPDLARMLAESIPGLELDAAAHAHEHAIEVQLPLLARLAPDSRVVGITIHSGELDDLQRFGEQMAGALANLSERPLLVISSDMNHYASECETRRRDRMALEALAALDPRRLYRTVYDHRISMCGVMPAVVVLSALGRLNALNRCYEVGYTTSAAVSRDVQHCVGYAGLLFA
jgi:AmmeMemoRadiSam system radical SAM enzyme/AmmeMemoRadiSam system protein B/AmmeMemoRadiSam system protein A